MSTQSLAPVKMKALRSIRAQTLQLFDLATSEEVLRTEPTAGFRPLLWHLAHIGVYQNYWVLQRAAGQPSINPPYDIYFDPIKTPREEAKVLPARAEIEAYLSETLRRVELVLERADLTARERNGLLSPGYALDLVLEHELQHQETIAFVLQSLPLGSKKAGPAPVSGARAAAQSEIHVPALRAPVGGIDGAFVYDNELPRHTVDVSAFFIDRDLTTNSEYAEFMAAGGYAMRELWSEEGWKWKESATPAPLYWSGPPWKERGFFAETMLRDDAPVTGVSAFEAEAYAAFRGKRLPSEAEWEVAAAWDPASQHMRRFPWGDEPNDPGSSSSSRSWGTTPVGFRQENTSALGLHDVIGNVWQWTSSQFRGYSGFLAYPYPEYSEVWFDGDHRVLRGGSWFTDRSLGRTSFRNFYRRRFRPGFNGIRCARNAR
ncbi:MAG TPA: SUMF1/EgtB/PvdO family nonheme iron enzyme [Candidatus Eremiobacteraceae bacterium]|nr:SUMF1/EgtB/PvdO family nonheme iron enzyme [Candidatus Eremiobacteraceae bacterium]